MTANVETHQDRPGLIICRDPSGAYRVKGPMHALWNDDPKFGHILSNGRLLGRELRILDTILLNS